MIPILERLDALNERWQAQESYIELCRAGEAFHEQLEEAFDDLRAIIIEAVEALEEIKEVHLIDECTDITGKWECAPRCPYMVCRRALERIKELGA